MIDLKELNKSKRAAATAPVLDAIAERWSPRGFSGQAVSTEDLTSILEAAAWAASSRNEQPWRFLVGRQGDEAYAKILEALVEANRVWAKSAPVLILSVASSSFAHGGQPNYYALHDAGAAGAYLALQASVLGLHTHSMGGFDREKARALFEIPAEYEIGAVTALGYLGGPEGLPEKLREMELAPRARRPLEQTVFAAWGSAAKL